MLKSLLLVAAIVAPTLAIPIAPVKPIFDTVQHCVQDSVSCPDGSSRSRDLDTCNVPPCDPCGDCLPLTCTIADQVTLDGSCCPICKPGTEAEVAVLVCPAGEIKCPNGVTLTRDPKSMCMIESCIVATQACNRDMITCENGETLSRDPLNNCEFPTCAQCQLVRCAAVTCSEKGVHAVTLPGQCCPSCPNEVAPPVCTTEVKTCPDGKTMVARDSNNKCEFKICPPVVECAQEVIECKNGETRQREPTRRCEFAPCDDCGLVDCALVAKCPGGVKPVQPVGACCATCPAVSIVCTMDVQVCTDGSTVSRNPNRNCDFDYCPRPIPVACNKDAIQCYDGTVLFRDPRNKCDFPPCKGLDCSLVRCAMPVCDKGVRPIKLAGECCAKCPKPELPVACSKELKICDGGKSVGRDPANNCEFTPCPIVGCTRDALECEDGTFKVRDPLNKCEFPACVDCRMVKCAQVTDCPGGVKPVSFLGGCCSMCPPKPAEIMCAKDLHICPDGTHVSRNPKHNCDFDKCPRPVPVMCERDARQCIDGTVLLRDPRKRCQFPACTDEQDCTLVKCANPICEGGVRPIKIAGKCCMVCPKPDMVKPCSKELHVCRDGSTVGRDPAQNCEFKPCPSVVAMDCRKDSIKCADGTVLNRDPANNCEFKPCVDCRMVKCAKVEKCADGAEPVAYMGGCCASCPTTLPPVCPADKFTCGADNKVTERDASKSCDFAGCALEYEGAPIVGEETVAGGASATQPAGVLALVALCVAALR